MKLYGRSLKSRNEKIFRWQLTQQFLMRERNLREKVLERLASGASLLPSGTPFWLAKKKIGEVVRGDLACDLHLQPAEFTER